MKKMIFVPVILLLVSCGMSPEEKAIADYEQTIEGTKIDLNLKVLKMEKLGETFWSDSVAPLEEYIDFKTKEKINDIKTRIYPDPEDSVKLAEIIAIYEGDKQGTFLEAPLKKLNYYKEMGNAKIGDLWEATYRINNPLLGGVEQELTKKYLIEPNTPLVLQVVE